MRLLPILFSLICLVGCPLGVEMSEPDRQRTDDFTAEIKRLNTNLEELKAKSDTLTGIDIRLATIASASEEIAKVMRQYNTRTTRAIFGASEK